MTNAPPTTLDRVSSAGAAASGELALVLLESLADPIYVLDDDWRVIVCNAAYAEHMGVSRAQLLGAYLWDTIPSSNRSRLEGAYARVKQTGLPDSFVQESVVYPDRYVDVRVFPVFGGVGVLFRDVTRRIVAERALAVSEDHLKRALSGADMGHWSWDAATDRMYLSERALALYGLDASHQGMTRTAIRHLALHPDDVPAVTKAAEDAHASHGQYETEYRVKRDGQWRWLRVMGGPHIVDGRVVGVHGLAQDIHERKLANERLRAEIEQRERAQQRQTLLIHELNHRVKNILAMVQAIALQTLSASDSPQAASKAVEQRLMALAQAHDVLTREGWDGAELTDIVSGSAAAHEAEPGARIRAKGPRVRLEPKAAVSLALVLHELATNAVKYGALSTDKGWVSLDWSIRSASKGAGLHLTWAEHDGPKVEPPKRKGFGTKLITRSLAAEQGSTELTYAPDGLVCRLSLLVSKPSGRGIPL